MPDGSMFLDIGAHVGLYSIKMKPSYCVYAFEASEANLKCLKKNVSAMKNVSVVPKAVWSQKTNLTWIERGSQSHIGLSMSPVECISIDSMKLWEDTAEADFLGMKIDTEGADFEVLLGAKETIKAYDNVYLVIEINNKQLKRFDRDKAQLLDLLDYYGFKCVSHDATILKEKNKIKAHFIKEK